MIARARVFAACVFVHVCAVCVTCIDGCTALGLCVFCIVCGSLIGMGECISNIAYAPDDGVKRDEDHDDVSIDERMSD